MKYSKTLRKRGLALLVAFLMCLSWLPVEALAADTTKLTDTFTLTYHNGDSDRRKPKTITDKNGNTITLPEAKEYAAGSSVELYMSRFLKVGEKYSVGGRTTTWEFCGWTLKANAGPALTPGSKMPMPYSDTVVYALWKTQGTHLDTPVTGFTVKWVNGYTPEVVLQTKEVKAFAADGTPICDAPPKDPTRPDKDGINFAFAGWSAPVLSETEKQTYIITAKWENPDTLKDPIVPDPPEKGDRIPDSWQYVVNYEVRNGTLTYGGQSDLSSAETVVTRRDDAGTPCNGGTAKLAAAHVATGTPIENYGNATWYIKATGTDGLGTETAAPTEGTVITGNVTYTVVYSAVKVTAVPNGGTWKDLPSNWDGPETGNKESALTNGDAARGGEHHQGRQDAGWLAGRRRGEDPLRPRRVCQP